jgi:hypothetical protein
VCLSTRPALSPAGGGAHRCVQATALIIGVWDHKWRCSPFEALPDAVAQRITADLEAARQTFADRVGRYRGARCTAEAALATEAQDYRGSDAIRLGTGAQLGASAVALGGSATALTEAAAALNLAAGRLGASGVADTVAKTTAGVGAAGFATILARLGFVTGGLALVSGAAYLAGGKYQREDQYKLRDELTDLRKKLDRYDVNIADKKRWDEDATALENERAGVAARIDEVKAHLAAIAAEAGQQAGSQTVDGFKSTDWAGAGAQAGSTLMWSLRNSIGPGVIGPGAGVRGVGGADGSAVPARAAGGPLDPDTPTLVGEYGPELITARRGGYVHAAGETRRMLSGGSSRGDVQVHIGAIHLDAGRGDVRAMASQLVDEIDRQVRAAMRGLQADLGYTS